MSAYNRLHCVGLLQQDQMTLLLTDQPVSNYSQGDGANLNKHATKLGITYKMTLCDEDLQLYLKKRRHMQIRRLIEETEYGPGNSSAV